MTLNRLTAEQAVLLVETRNRFLNHFFSSSQIDERVIKKGIYEVRIQREYSPRENRQVMD